MCRCSTWTPPGSFHTLQAPRVADLPDVQADDGVDDDPDRDVDTERDDRDGEDRPADHRPDREPFDAEGQAAGEHRGRGQPEEEAERADQIGHQDRAGQHERRLGEGDDPGRLVDDHEPETQQRIDAAGADASQDALDEVLHTLLPYMSSTSASNVVATAPRRTFCVAVSSPSVVVEFLGQHPERLDLLDRVVPGVDRVDDALDQGHHLGFAGQVAVGGVADAAPLRPLPDGVELDADERGQERAPVADDDRLLDERRGLQRVLDLARGDVLATGRDDDVLGAVGDLQMAYRRAAARRHRCAASRPASWPPRSPPRCGSSRRTCPRAGSGSPRRRRCAAPPRCAPRRPCRAGPGRDGWRC